MQNFLLPNRKPIERHQISFTKIQSQANKSHHKRSESTRSIFGLPKSILNQFRNLKQKIQEKQSPKIKKQNKIQLGQIAHEYQQHLRKTILSQTKQVFKPHKHEHSTNEIMTQIQQNLQTRLRRLKNKVKNDKIENRDNHQSNSYHTLNILQRVILKGANDFKRQQESIQLNATRLPIIYRKESKKRKSLAAFDSKYYYSPQNQKNDIYIKQNQSRDRKQSISGWDIAEYDY